MTTGENDEKNEEQVYYLWECPQCGIANQAGLIFCPNCAFNEGLAEPTPDRPEKIGKIAEALSRAIDWSLKHGQLKPAEVLAQAAKRHSGINSLADLRRLSATELNRLADNYLNLNRLGATGAGLTAGLPGGLAAFATIPADVSAVVYFSLRCISGVSQSYSLETRTETGQTIELLAFAYAAKFETLIIGQKRLENIQLAAFLLQNPEHTRLIKACLLKQLSAHLTVDFAKTTWATFLPIVGGVVNGVDNFWFLGEVGKRSKQFYHALLPILPVLPPSIKPALPVPPPPVALEIREERLALAGETYDLYLVYPDTQARTAFVLVIGDRPEAEKVAEKFGMAGCGAAALDRALSPAGLNAVWAYLAGVMPASLASYSGGPGLGLFGSGEGANVSLAALPWLAPRPTGVVLYNPARLEQPVLVDVPLLIQVEAEASSQPPAWLSYLQPAGERGLISINTFEAESENLNRSWPPDNSAPVPEWVWRDTLEWFKRPG
jgi:hypothetical protein